MLVQGLQQPQAPPNLGSTLPWLCLCGQAGQQAQAGQEASAVCTHHHRRHRKSQPLHPPAPPAPTKPPHNPPHPAPDPPAQHGPQYQAVQFVGSLLKCSSGTVVQ
jgi:hypothetical protein